MKKSFALIALVISFAGFYACQKNNSNPVTNTTNTVYLTPTLTATVNGIPIVYVASLNGSLGYSVNILGAAPHSGLNIFLPVPTDTATYAVTPGNSGISIAYDSLNLQNYIPVGPSYIKVTAYNKATGQFSGTFSATLQDSAKGEKTVITNGVFSNF